MKNLNWSDIAIHTEKDIPLFAVDLFGNENMDFGIKRKIFGNLKRLYAHNKLQDKLGFDIVRFVSGEIKDKEKQNVKVVGFDKKIYSAVLVIVTARETNNKYALIVFENETNKTIEWLYNGEWLKNGFERYKY